MQFRVYYSWRLTPPSEGCPFRYQTKVWVDEDDDEDCPEEDSDDVPDTEKFGSSGESAADEKAEPERVIEEHRPSLLKPFVKVKRNDDD